MREFVVGVLSDPDTIRRGLDALARRETEEVREDSQLLAETLSEKLSQNARTRRAYQDQQAAGLMTLEELAARLEELAATRDALEAELASLERSRQKARELERDRDAALASLATSIPEALDELTGEEINTVYRKLRPRVVPSEEGFDATGVLCTLEPTPAGRRGRPGLAGKAASVSGTLRQRGASSPRRPRHLRWSPLRKGLRLPFRSAVSANRSFGETTSTARSGAPGQ